MAEACRWLTDLLPVQYLGIKKGHLKQMPLRFTVLTVSVLEVVTHTDVETSNFICVSIRIVSSSFNPCTRGFREVLLITEREESGRVVAGVSLAV